MNDEICGVYMIASPSNNVLYTGMSTMLPARIESHKDSLVKGFTQKYNCTKLVYFEITPDEDTALLREKQIKGWTRAKKAAIIEMENPQWRDLFEDLLNLVAGY
jgi:putative endonuclease